MSQFASAVELAAFLGTTFDSEQTTAANLCLAGASGAIKRHTGQQVELVTDDQVVLQGTWSKELILPQWPVLGVSSVKINNGVVAPGTWFLTGNGRLYRGYLPIFNGPDDWGGDLFLSSWLGPISAVGVTYSHGFDLIPDDLKLLVLKVAARTLNNPSGSSGEHIGNYSDTFSVGGDGDGTLTKAEKVEIEWLCNHP